MRFSWTLIGSTCHLPPSCSAAQAPVSPRVQEERKLWSDLLIQKGRGEGNRTSLQVVVFSDPAMYIDHNFCILSILLAEMLQLFLTEAIPTKAAKLLQRKEIWVQRRDLKPWGSSKTWSCACQLSWTLPTHLLAVLDEMGLAPEHKIVSWVYFFALSTDFHPLCKDQKSQELVISKSW